MRRKTAIIAVAIVVVMIGGGIAASNMLKNDSGGDRFSFDKCYFDLSGAKSLAIMKDSTATASASSVLISSDPNEPALMKLGDSATGDKTSLYKKDELGNYVKVKLFESKAAMESETEQSSKMEGVQAEYSVVSMEITDDGKYAYMILGKLDMNNNTGDYVYYSDVSQIVLSIMTGKIYELPVNTTATSFKRNADQLTADSFRNTLFGRSMLGPGYTYLGNSGAILFFISFEYGKKSVCSAVEENDELVVKEILKDDTLANLGGYKLYKNGIMRVFTEGAASSNDSYLIFSDGKLKKCSEDSLFECGDYICSSVTYRDPETKYFPLSASIITGYNTDTHDFITSSVNYSVADSYNMAIQSEHNNEIYKKVETNSTTMVLMKNIKTITKVRLNNDCTSVNLGDTEMPITLEKLDIQYANPIQNDTSWASNWCYTMIRNHICQYVGTISSCGVSPYYSPGDMIVNDGFIYKVSGASLMRYDLINGGAASAIPISGLISVKSLEIDGDRALIKGISDSGSELNGVFDFSTGTVDVTHNNILKEVRIAALS